MTAVKSALVASRPGSKEAMISSLNSLVATGLLRPPVVTEIGRFPWPSIDSAIGDTIAVESATTDRELRLEEFRALQEAASEGAPAQPSPTPGAPPQFEVIQHSVRTIAMGSGQNLRITPVNRLRVVLVQTGYRRLDPLNPWVDLGFDDEQRIWYPGVELFGEGVFIDLPSTGSKPHPTGLNGPAASAWFDAWIDPGSLYRSSMPGSLHELHPQFVWWHTLSHRLINSMAIDSGYSSASIRERVYVDVDEQTGEATGGVLLYTAQPGGDGTLGGMTALVPQFEQVLGVAMRDLDACSNDPLCGEETFGPGKYNGAICYSCGLVSETSCEHRNMNLDRKLLLENL